METSPGKERVRVQGRKIENKEGGRERGGEGWKDGAVGGGGKRDEERKQE